MRAFYVLRSNLVLVLPPIANQRQRPRLLYNIYKCLFVDVVRLRLLKVNTLDNRLFLWHYAAQL